MRCVDVGWDLTIEFNSQKTLISRLIDIIAFDLLIFDWLKEMLLLCFNR